MTNSSQSKKPDVGELGGSGVPPRMSEDSQSFIGLKLRELYDNVVAEPVPDRILQLLEELGDKKKAE